MSRLRDVRRILGMPCEGMTRLASESLDRELGRFERFALGSHLLVCTACRRYRRQIVLLRSAVRRLKDDVENDRPLPGPDMPTDLREKIKHDLNPN